MRSGWSRIWSGSRTPERDSRSWPVWCEEMTKRIRIAGVSDVSVGYGSPQILAFMRSLQEVYGGEAVIFEPDQPERPPRPALDGVPAGRIERVITAYHPHHHRAGRIEYVTKVARRLNALRPRVLVIFCTYSLPVLLKLRYRPDFVVYYSIESIAAYGPFDIELNRRLAGAIDLLIFPEEHRAMRDVARCSLTGIPLAILYNCATDAADADEVTHPRRRNNRIFYAGTIDRSRTLAEYFVDRRLEGVPIDLYGHLSGWEDPGVFLAGLPGGVRYRGYLEATALARIRGEYAYSIVMWAPTSENQLYAAPNKFFEAVASGVPPVAAPHPQCKMLIARYGCGIVMDDWSFDAFHSALRRALTLVGTPEYYAMVESCRQAVAQELSWDRQFEKVRRHLPEVS